VPVARPRGARARREGERFASECAGQSLGKEEATKM
jgi:hypothetical protein